MQTFLPYADFNYCALVLDRARLGKQRVEARQLLSAIARPPGSGGWTSHPAAAMWRGWDKVLKLYFDCISVEWVRRGYRHNLGFYYVTGPDSGGLAALQRCLKMPPWLGLGKLHSSHRAALLAKDPGWYGQFPWDEEPGIHYYWPTGSPRS